MGQRIHILGASGTGVSTLGRALATERASQFFDTDDFYWLPTDPPFRKKRGEAERLELMRSLFLPRDGWVLSGSFLNWGRAIEPRLTHVIFLSMPAGQRLARLRARERRRYGAGIAPGGAHEAGFRSFLDWAASYDDPSFSGRSRHLHEAWLSALTCHVIRLDARSPVETLVRDTCAALDPETAPS